MIYDNYEMRNNLGSVKTLQKEFTQTPDRMNRNGIMAVVYLGPDKEQKAIIYGNNFWEIVEKPNKPLGDKIPSEIENGVSAEERIRNIKLMNERNTPGELVPQEKVEINAANSIMSIEEASGIAKKLTHIIDTCELFSIIQGNKYVQVEGWQALDGMLQVNPIVKNVIEAEDYIECQVDIENFGGEAIGRGIARCYFEEEMKKGNGQIIKRWYNLAGQLNKAAVLSMAQTRAIGKANRNKYAWIIRLAGYSPTPSEEMEGVK